MSMNDCYARQILKEIYAEGSGFGEEEEAIFGRWDNELLYQEDGLGAWSWEMDNTFMVKLRLRSCLSVEGGQSK